MFTWAEGRFQLRFWKAISSGWEKFYSGIYLVVGHGRKGKF